MKTDKGQKKSCVRYQNANTKHFAVQRSPRLDVGATTLTATSQMPKDFCRPG
ncbi:hypothetical protein RISK_002607 [Rhodopirellula islandica]|uniref:Uncharacterized protein n=1 Tax=Rhodopirellula islandica TaxID=595434 RepID=A0A0J1BFS4_RHOIS|nr:hypothetical protein RISK_002607 [Rhodopirellula islandica]